jgi:hypothetical protein
LTALRLAYVANIVILVPIAFGTVFRLFPTDQAAFIESPGWRIMAGALWLAILVLSMLGLRHPLRYSPVLLLQEIYKTTWLAVYAAPRLMCGDFTSIPWGITASFAAIALIWPFLIPWKYLFASGEQREQLKAEQNAAADADKPRR